MLLLLYLFIGWLMNIRIYFFSWEGERGTNRWYCDCINNLFIHWHLRIHWMLWTFRWNPSRCSHFKTFSDWRFRLLSCGCVRARVCKYECECVVNKFEWYHSWRLIFRLNNNFIHFIFIKMQFLVHCLAKWATWPKCRIVWYF